MNLICPQDLTLLELRKEDGFYYCSLCNSKYPVDQGVVIFQDKKDEFYEGKYSNNLSTIKYNPKGKSLITKFPLWLINSGYLWYVDRYIPEGSTIIDLGCGGGVNFFGSNYRAIGLDLSLRALKKITGVYYISIKSDASIIPIENESIDAIVGSYFWEHLKPEFKSQVLNECRRILKPKGKIIFLYDLENENPLITKFKRENISLYTELFIERDGHFGYQTFEENKKIFERSGFISIKHLGFERTIFQSESVYKKLAFLGGIIGFFSKVGILLNKSYLFYLYTLFVRIIDSTVGNLFPINYSRIMISVLRKQEYEK